MFSVWLLLNLQQEVRVGYEPFAGLQVSVNGVSVVRGSAFDYTDPKTGKTLYTSRWAPKEVSRLPDGTIRVRYSGDNGNAIGTHEFKQTLDGLTAHYEFRWRGEGTALVQNVLALVWAPAVCHGDIRIGGPFAAPYLKPTIGDWDARKLGGPSNAIEFDAQLARVKINLRGQTVSLFDARNFEQDWAKSGCLFWIGRKGMAVMPGQTLEMTAEWTFQPKMMRPAEPVHLKFEGVKNTETLVPVASGFPTLLAPKESKPDGSWLDLQSGDTGGPETDRFRELVCRRWRVDPSEVRASILAQVGVPTMPEEGFEVIVAPSGVRINSRDQAGLNHALQFLARMVEARAGKLGLPGGTYRDWPSVKWRGVHLFSGADTPSFQAMLVERVLAPLRFNHALIQCERTTWSVSPTPSKPGWMSKEALRRLFETYAASGIEPTPLIQSLGHMDWLLEGSNRELAVNPSVPYTLDVRKKAARGLIESVWKEAIELLSPKSVHFGLDETDMRGMPDDPTIADRLWDLQVPELFKLARKLKAKPMLWGDMMLAPGEAPDATHAKTKEAAAHKRFALPKETTVLDWHYLNSDDPAKFNSLKTWTSLGLKSVATSWWRPRNIRAHTMAAIANGSGTLQATWAGYQTTELSAFSDPDQFAAYVVAADYSWTGRTELPSGLGYDPLDVLKRLLWHKPNAVMAEPGQQWSREGSTTTSVRIGPVLFARFAAIGLQTPLTGEGSLGGSEIVLETAGEASELALALDCVGWEKEGETIARVVLSFADGSEQVSDVLYGTDVRAPEDKRQTLRTDAEDGIAAIRIDLGRVRKIVRVRLVGVGQTAGVRVHGVSTF